MKPVRPFMLVLPMPMITALALGFLFVHSVLKGDRSWLFVALLGACALQGVVVSLAQYYGVGPLRLVQPVTATLVPPLAWVTFQATAVRPFAAARDLPHLAVPVLTALCAAFWPAALDIAVPGAFLAYGAAILFALRPGADVLPLTRLETGDRPGLIWRGIALALIVSALGDASIAVAQWTGTGWLQAWIISVSSSLSLGLVGALALSQSLAGGEETATAVARTPDAKDLMRDAELMERLKMLIVADALYLDPGLTLDRLSRRLRVPAKQLSQTINRATGGNVSRYVNGFRIRHACERLKAGENVTSAMLNSGFNTKSNFNREFLRETGSSPTAWLLMNAEGSDPTK